MKNKEKKFDKFLIYFFAFAVISCLIAWQIMSCVSYISASGSQSVTFTGSEVTDGQWITSGTHDTWSTQVNKDTATLNTGSAYKLSVGWEADTTSNLYYKIYSSCFSANVSSLAGKTITSANISMYCENLIDENTEVLYVALYKYTENELLPSPGDYDYPYDEGSIRYSNIVDMESAGLGWVEFTLNQADVLDQIASDSESDTGLFWLYIATPYQMQNVAPSNPGGSYKEDIASFTNYNGANRPKLTISYTDSVDDRVINYDINAAVDNTTDGTETADNITWQSPRAGYVDEGMYFVVNGDSGAEISLKLVDEDGTILDSIDDSIRVDNDFNWFVDLPNDLFGWVRVIETNNNLKSYWGYQMPQPDSDQNLNYVYAVNTEDPQYLFAFSRYITYEDDAFVLHWKTNIQSDEYADHDLRIYVNGDNVTSTKTIFDKSFEYINDDYFGVTDNNTGLAHWRYMIFSPKIENTGIETYDGMIYNLNANYSSSTAGFLQAQIIDTTDNSTLADSHSCYWYIPAEKDGLIMTLTKSEYKAGENMNFRLQVGGACRIDENLPDLNIKLINSLGSIQYDQDQFYQVGLNEYEFDAPVVYDDYVLRLEFSGSDKSWSYIHDIPFEVVAKTTAETSGLVENIKNWIINQGMDNDTGYWALLLIGMVLLFLLAYSSPVMRVTLPLVYLGLFLVWKFIDPWIIVLLALGAGLALFGMLRKKFTGGEKD